MTLMWGQVFNGNKFSLKPLFWQIQRVANRVYGQILLQFARVYSKL